MKRGTLIILISIFLISFSSAYEIYYYHTDSLGSPVAVTDENASVVWSADYEPFGKSFNEIGENSYKYNAKEKDNSELLYYGARYYDADIGRFTTADTIAGNIKSPQTLNRYAYTLNNPIKYVDPNGNEPVVAVYFGNREQQDVFLNQFSNYKKYVNSWRNYGVSGAEDSLELSAEQNTQKLQRHLSDAEYVMIGGHHYLNTNLIFHGEHSENPNYDEYFVDAAVSLDFGNKVYNSAKMVCLPGCNTLKYESPTFESTTKAFPNAALLGYASKSAANINADITKRFFEFADKKGGIESLGTEDIAALWAYSGYEVYNEKGETTNVVGIYKQENNWRGFSSSDKEQMLKVKSWLEEGKNK